MADRVLDLIRETSFTSMFVKNCQTHFRFSWLEDHVSPLMKSVLMTISEILKSRQNKNDEKIAFEIKDLKGNFIFGSILTYTKPAEDEDKGNWNLEFTFNKSDIEGVNSIGDNLNTEYITSLERNFCEMTHRRFKNPEFLHKCVQMIFTTLSDYMASNAKEGEEFAVELPDYLECISTVENGEIIISVIPGSIIKQAIKDDTIV